MPDWFREVFLCEPATYSLSFSDTAPHVLRRGREVIAPMALAKGEDIPSSGAFRVMVVDATLPDSFFLARDVTAPLAAAGSLHQLAALDLMRRTPFTAVEVAWALDPPNREADGLVARQWVARHTDLEMLSTALARQRMKLRRVHAKGQTGSGPIADLTGRFGAGRRWHLRLNAALAATTVLLAAALWLVPVLLAERSLAAASSDLETLRAATLVLRVEVDRLNEVEVEQSAFIDEVVRRPRLSTVLRDLTVALPDTVWLTDLGFAPERVVLSGETSASAAELVLNLSGTKGIHNPRLNGPVERTATGDERFDLALDIDKAR